MTADLAADVTLTREGPFVKAVLERSFDKGCDAVWNALTDSTALPQWLAPGTIEPRVGGAARLDFQDSGIVIDSVVTAFERGITLEYSWSTADEPERPVRWDLRPEPEGCRLRLTLRVPATEDAGRACAGWEAHLEMLAAALEGVPIKFPFETFKAARDAYRKRLETVA